MLRNNSDMPKTLKNKIVSGNPRPYSTTTASHHSNVFVFVLLPLERTAGLRTSSPSNALPLFLHK